MLELINKKSLADEVAHRLNEQISLGQYRLNEKLPIEPELMRTFGVGRSTIREAIKILVNSGFLRVQQGVGTFVESVTGNKEPLDQRLKRASIADLDEIRQLLEVKIAEKAAINRTEEDILAIKKELDVELAIKDLFQFTTISELGKYLEIQLNIYSEEKDSTEFDLMYI